MKQIRVGPRREGGKRTERKKSRAMGLESRESVLWRRKPIGNNLAKLSVLWGTGLHLGAKGSTGEMVSGAADCVGRTRMVWRRPEEMRWNAEEIEPWDRKSEKADDEVVHPRGIERMPEEILQEEKRAVTGELNLPKSFHTKRGDDEGHGYTRGCPGCRALFTGTSRQKHTIQCRSRVESEMGSHRRVKATKRRPEDFLDKVMARAGEGGGGAWPAQMRATRRSTKPSAARPRPTMAGGWTTRRTGSSPPVRAGLNAGERKGREREWAERVEHPKGHDAPLAKNHDDDDGDDEPLSDQDARRYRRLAATVSHLAPDRPDLQFTASVLSSTGETNGEQMVEIEEGGQVLEGGRQGGVRVPRRGSRGCAGLGRVLGLRLGGMQGVGGARAGGDPWRWVVEVVVESAGDCGVFVRGSRVPLCVEGGGGDAGGEVDDGRPRWRASLKPHMDVSVAKPMANRQRIGKIQHLVVRFLWLQDLAK